MEEIFEIRTLVYNLKNDTIFRNKNFKTVRYGQESLSYLGLKKRLILPTEIKNSTTLQEFKNKINSP